MLYVIFKKELYMKKLIAVMALGFSGAAFSAGFVSVDVDKVNGLAGSKDSVAQYVRAGTTIGDYSLGLQSRTARLDGGGMLNSLELTTSHKSVSFMGVTPFAGMGYDNGLNAASKSAFQYGLFGATTGAQVGPGYALLGVKSRAGTTQDGPRTKQTVAFTTYSIPVTKTVSVNLNASRSYETIKETAYGLGLAFKF